MGVSDSFKDIHLLPVSPSQCVISVGVLSPTECHNLKMKMGFQLISLGKSLGRVLRGQGMGPRCSGAEWDPGDLCSWWWSLFSEDWLCLGKDKSVIPKPFLRDRSCAFSSYFSHDQEGG